MIYTVHGGHAAAGQKYCGASGYCNESTEDRLVKNQVIKFLQAAGHTVYDCTVDTGTSQSNVLTQIKAKINSHPGATANISIHFNALSKASADGKVKGTECEVYSLTGTAAEIGKRICSKMASLGFTNRGNKVRTNLAVLKGITNGGANILVEVCFCDDEDDFKLYRKVGAEAVGKAIAEGILGTTISSGEKNTSNVSTYKVKVTASSLNIRKGPGTAYAKNGVIKKGEVYTIVQTSGKWGLLKSGAGWICLDYTTTV